MTKHTIRFEFNGGEKPLFWEGVVAIGPGAAPDKPFHLERLLIPLTVPVVFTSDPEGADVYQVAPETKKPFIGATFSPLKVRFAPGDYSFRFSADGYGSVVKQVSLDSDEMAVKAVLPYCSVELQLDISPSGAKVVCKEYPLDPSVRKVYLLPGEYTLIVSKEGYHTERRLIKVVGNGDEFSEGGKRNLKRRIVQASFSLKEKHAGPAEGQGFVNSVGMKFEWIKSGVFKMGSNSSERGHQLTEAPVRKVSVSSSFWIGAYEVSQDAYMAVMKTNPSAFVDPMRPVDSVSWKMANDFCDRLTDYEVSRGMISSRQKYLLPSEAQWEYACRAGTATPFCYGTSLSSKDANFDGNYPYGGAPKALFRNKTTLTGLFKPNAFGIYDMHGNVFEWCSDLWHENYRNAPLDEESWLKNGKTDYVLRGGAYSVTATDCRSAARKKAPPDIAYKSYGFRVILTTIGN